MYMRLARCTSRMQLTLVCFGTELIYFTNNIIFGSIISLLFYMTSYLDSEEFSFL
uniref:Uncharacterized protein n=1 Tax=Arundo donax TaxID=35708 RepID=A0A0A8ZDF0_ARUDO